MRRLLVLTCLALVVAISPAAASLLTPTLDINAAPTTANFGATIDISGTVTDPPNTAGLVMAVQRSGDSGVTWSDVTGPVTPTDAAGAYTATDVPLASGTYTYRASWAGDGVTYGPGQADSSVVSVLAVPALDINAAPTTANFGATIDISGTVTDPATTPGLVIVVQRSGNSGATWSDVTGTVTLTDAAGAYTATDVPPAAGTYTYRASWVGDGVTYGPGHVESSIVTVLAMPALDITAVPTTLNVGQTIDISGTVTDPATTPGLVIVVQRSGDSGATWSDVTGTVTPTDAAGAYTATDVPPSAGTYSYRASWAGDGVAYGPRQVESSTPVTVSKWSAGLTLDAPATSIVYGGSVKLSGLWSSGSGVGPGDLNVAITRTKAGGLGVPLGSALLSGGNTYSRKDTPPSAGTFTYTATWAGDHTHDPATVDLVVVVARRSTALSLTVRESTITYGEATRLVATLKRGDPDSQVVFQKKSGAKWVAIGTVPLRKDGTARLAISPIAKHTYRAVFNKTTGLRGSVSATSTVQVRPVMASRMIGTFTRKGDYAVYKCCTAYFSVRLKPSHPRLSWMAVVQYYGKGKWRALGSGSYRFDASGRSAIYLNATAGYRYRVRGRFEGDGDHLSAKTSWNYFRFG